MPNATRTLLATWEQLANRLVFLEKRFVYSRGDLRLHPSELHGLLAIRQEPDANATRLAARLGVTKGAVSQLLKRLEAKGVVGKRSDPYQKNEVTAFFTPLGREAVEDFLAGRTALRERFAASLDALSDDQRQVIRDFLDQASLLLQGLE